MDDITVLGLETMEIQTVRQVQPHHFDQYWQAGILSHKADFEMNVHGPYYGEILGSRRELNRTLSKMESSMQVGKVVNARHMVCHVGPYGEYDPGTKANEQVANVMTGVVERVRSIWGVEGEEEDYAAFPWVHESEPTLVGIETSGRQELWGTVEEVLEVVNHVEGTVPVLNMAHIHARGHGRLKTSEDYAELFDQVRETIGGKKFYCHFAGVEHRMGNAQHYTQIKKSDLKFEPFAEYLAEEGDWMDITIISDSPLLEHDAMYMVQHYDKARQRLLEIRARDDRRMKLAAEAGIDVEELARREKEQAEARKKSLESDKDKKVAAKEKKAEDAKKKAEDAKKKAEAATEKKGETSSDKKKKDGKMMSFASDKEEFEDLF
ncbi:MAG: TIM barrel protein [Candidatus Thalassarchaeaceae archaeon]|jgi:deoxyribonuclease-4|nr:TIM barrel protein [Candidatus Thalassarchaeaceae archaeon]MDP6317805.1 TIM barrel protein [Candidatus Thalassarchaeaceae archaeon]HJN69947.1 TIM barrel protein [Candidatus Thalassarchaeaceae archaeon]